MADFDIKYLTHHFESSGAQNLGALAVGGWDVPRIRAAREAHQLGRFAASAGFAQAIKSDARVYGAWAQRVGAPLSLARRVSTAAGWEGDELGEAARAEGAALFGETSTACPPVVISTVFERIPVHGFTWLQVSWTPRADGSRIDPKVKPWPTQATYWDSARECYMASTIGDGAVEMHHGDGKWICVEPYGVQSYLHGAIIPVALCFADRGWAIRDASNFSGAHGAPGLIGKLPSGEAPEGEIGKAYLAEMAKMQQPRARMLEPDGANTRFLEAMSSNWQIFGAIIDREARDITIAFLGQDGTSQNAGGTYTKALVLQNVLFDLVAKDVGAVGVAFTTGLLAPFTAINRGRPELAPALAWAMPKPVEDQRLAERAARSKAFREEVAGFRSLGIPVDEARLAAELGVDVPLLPGSSWPMEARASAQPAPTSAPAQSPPPVPAPPVAPPA